MNDPVFLTKIKADLVKKEVMTVSFGFANSIVVELQDNWKEICEEVGE